MWVEEIRLENIRCFERTTIRLTNADNEPHRWVTFLGENGAGKSTLLQALALLLAGPEGASTLIPQPLGWLREESRAGKIGTRIHQGKRDPGKFGETKTSKSFGYTFFVTGSKSMKIRNKTYSEPQIVESSDTRLSWLRRNALSSKNLGWFASGYGAFRRLTRSSQIIVPSLDPQMRHTNFTTQFNEDHSLATFERWMVYLDYRIAKADDKDAEYKKQIGIQAINRILPEGVDFDTVSPEGRILFRVNGRSVPTISLSDGYRSVLALVGDLVWRLMQAFPESEDPLHEEGVVLIDELDIHLHPTWQRQIAQWLRGQFPNIQFIITTHSPLVASGAGEDALTIATRMEDDKFVHERVDDVAAMNVDHILRSRAFRLVSSWSPQAVEKIQRFEGLRAARHRTRQEDTEYQTLLDFVEKARPYDPPPPQGTLDEKVDRFLREHLDDQDE